MKPIIRITALLMILVSSVVIVILPCTAQQITPLLTESFETGSGTTPPSGWVIEQVTGTITGITFVSNSANPTISSAFDGSRFVRYNSFSIAGGSTRLKSTTALSTTGHAGVLVDFAWYEDPGSATSNDKVEVQWSLDGTNWTTAGTFSRYNAVPGWKLKHQWLPAAANNKPLLYVAFLFTSANGNNCALDLVHVTCGTSATGAVLSGYIRDVNTLSPVAGAAVAAGAAADTSMSDGFYAMYGLSAGSATLYCTAGCYSPNALTVALTAGNITTANMSMAPSPVFTGTITDGCTGAPVAGALVSLFSGGPNSAMTNSAGVFLMPCITVAGTQQVLISKTGYETFSGTFTFVPNTTTTYNLALFCTANPPGTVTAALNNPANPTAVNLGWQVPQGNYQLLYDDSSQEDFTVWASAGNLDAVKFTPLGWPAKVTGGNINIGKSSDYPANAQPLQSFTVYAAKADGPGGVPGTLLDSATVAPTGFGWVNFTFTAPVSINSGEFYLVMKQGGIPPHGCGMGIDTNSSQLRSWSRFVTGSGPWVPASHNYMMRAVMTGTGGPVLLDNSAFTPSYQAWRLLQGQESNTAAWTSIYTGNAANCADNSWPGLPSAPYRWAVRAVYPPGSRLSGPSFSNVLGKNYTATVSVQSTSDCSKCGKNTDVRLTNAAYPDTMYTIHLDSTGHGQRGGIWKGNYSFSYSQFSCLSVNLVNIFINGDTTITFNITEAKPAPTGLSINNQSLLATWNPPRVTYDYFFETWSSGSFATNQWIVSGGNNWQISNTIGNPAPSAIFSWAPQCTNCSQTLTSKLITGVDAPKVHLSYDITLSNAGTTNINTMAVELWNGTTWSALKVYDNQNGSFPWTTETLDITGLFGNGFKIRFRASGVDTYSINYWGVDNIRISGHDSVSGAPGCMLGYTVAINNTLAAFVTDTFTYIPPQQVIYGHPYQFCVRAVYNGGPSAAICDTFTAKFLYPPKNLLVTPLECTGHLGWDKPDDPVALTALTGYDIYRNGAYIHTNNGPDSLEYYDNGLSPGIYTYGVRSRYNLGVYGFTGQTGTSLILLDQAPDTVHCGFPVPFHDGFEQGNFTYHNWTFAPNQGNWGISTFLKSNAPFADFSWQPVRNNYSYAMVSDNIDAFSWKCAALWLDFDYKLADHNATGNEKMKVEAWYDNDWHLLKLLANNGSVDWTTLHLNLSAVSGKGFKLRFVAFGVNSGDILHWYIDNINVYGICTPPQSLNFSVNGLQTNLSWAAPACTGSTGPAGYNVYRTGSTGVPPFILRNQTPVTGTTYTDNTGPAAGGIYSYYVTAISDDPTSSAPLCESPGSDTIVVNTVGIPGKPGNGIKVYPNPATGIVHVESERNILLLQIMDYKGETVLIRRDPDARAINLDLSGYPPGVYFFRVTGQLENRIIKVIISH
ncbi:MAG: carboxypeptidase regulatory-like domain-containing protein [Bacteroidota bacterium]